MKRRVTISAILHSSFNFCWPNATCALKCSWCSTLQTQERHKRCCWCSSTNFKSSLFPNIPSFYRKIDFLTWTLSTGKSCKSANKNRNSSTKPFLYCFTNFSEASSLITEVLAGSRPVLAYSTSRLWLLYPARLSCPVSRSSNAFLSSHFSWDTEEVESEQTVIR